MSRAVYQRGTVICLATLTESDCTVVLQQKCDNATLIIFISTTTTTTSCFDELPVTCVCVCVCVCVCAWALLQTPTKPKVIQDRRDGRWKKWDIVRLVNQVRLANPT